MTKVLLTGGAGFIGSHCVEHWMSSTDWHVTVADSFRHRGRRERLRPAMEAFPDRIDLLKIDLAQPYADAHSGQMWAEMVRRGPYDVVVNMASESHVDRSISDPVGTWRNNTLLASTVLEYARQEGCGVFVQVSTDEVFGPAPPGHDHGEWSSIVPSNPYSASKAAQEALAISYWRTYGVPLLITNTMNVFGPRQDAEKFIPKTVAHLLAGRPMTVHGSEEQCGSRYYLHAKSYADAVRHLIQSTAVNRYPACELPSRYNVVGSREVFNDEMVRLVASMLGVAPLLEYVDFHSTRPGHDLRYALNGAKLRATGWRDPNPFHQALRETVRWYDNNRDALREYRPEAG